MANNMGLTKWADLTNFFFRIVSSCYCRCRSGGIYPLQYLTMGGYQALFISSSVDTTKNTALMEIQPWVDWVLSVAVANLTKSALFCISPFNFS